MLFVPHEVYPASDNIEIVEKVEANEMTTFQCIAAGGCKFKLGSSCTIEYCSGEREHDDENSTVDKDKLIILE
jgi:hypothetical protein